MLFLWIFFVSTFGVVRLSDVALGVLGCFFGSGGEFTFSLCSRNKECLNNFSAGSWAVNNNI